MAPGPGNSNGGVPSAAGNTGNPAAGSAGVGINAGSSNGGTSNDGGGASPGGTNSGGAATGGSSGSGVGGGDPGGDPVANPLEVTAAPDLHQHSVAGGRPAAIDNRLPKVVGKLIVNVEVDDGNVYDYGVKHGYHVLGLKIFHCDIPTSLAGYQEKGRDFNGDCRLETFDGEDHDKGTTAGHAQVSPADSIMGKTKQALTELAAQYAEEGWAYFLGADGNVRWSDVGFTGYSHGATSAFRWAKKVKVWRAVARSGPRDNICGMYEGQTCPDTVISTWLDEPSATPNENLFGLVGTKDGEYDDITFAMDRLELIGEQVSIYDSQPPYDNSHRLIIDDGINNGHDNFVDKKFWPAMDYVWGTPAENVAYANSQ